AQGTLGRDRFLGPARGFFRRFAAAFVLVGVSAFRLFHQETVFALGAVNLAADQFRIPNRYPGLTARTLLFEPRGRRHAQISANGGAVVTVMKGRSRIDRSSIINATEAPLQRINQLEQLICSSSPSVVLAHTGSPIALVPTRSVGTPVRPLCGTGGPAARSAG